MERVAGLLARPVQAANSVSVVRRIIPVAREIYGVVRVVKTLSANAIPHRSHRWSMYPRQFRLAGLVERLVTTHAPDQPLAIAAV